MKTIKLSLIALFFTTSALIVGATQSFASELVKGVVKDGRGQDVRYIVYLPTGYEDGEESYPVLYLLHGLTDDEKTWSSAEKGQMQGICDAYFDAKPDRKRIIVMPDARATWYRDVYGSDDKYETFFFETLIPTIEKEYRCKTDKANRAVAGLSMGGYGTLLYAVHRPDLFSAAYAMSPAVSVGQRRPKAEEEDFDAKLAYAEANDVVLQLEKLEDKNAVKFTIDCGDDDFCLQGAWEFFRKAQTLKVPCELRVRNGVHSWDYWRVSLPKALDFFSGDLP